MQQCLKPLRIVVADDEHDTVMTLRELLRDEGHQVLAAHNGRNAVEAVRHFDPDVVILDIAMPDVTGWDVAREIRETRGPSRPLLIAMSGRYKQQADKVLGRIAGFHHYLVKPYDTDALLALLAGFTTAHL